MVPLVFGGTTNTAFHTQWIRGVAQAMNDRHVSASSPVPPTIICQIPTNKRNKHKYTVIPMTAVAAATTATTTTTTSAALVAVTAAPPALDFEALLSREYRPAGLTRLVARDAWNTNSNSNNNNDASGGANLLSSHKKEQQQQKQQQNNVHNKQQLQIIKGTKGGSSSSSSFSAAASSSRPATAKEIAARQEATNRLVWSLVTRTPAFTRHLPPEQQKQQRENNNNQDDDDHPSRLLAYLSSRQKKPHRHQGGTKRTTVIVQDIAPAFHPVQLGDWESKIDWEGVKDGEGDEDDEENNHHIHTTTAASPKIISSKSSSSSDALTWLKRPRNPLLDALQFDDTTISWDGDTDDLLRKAAAAPLILELGVAGQSVARHVYQNTVLSAQRPIPALKSEAYQDRLERDWSAQPISSTAEVSKGSLHADKDKMEALIEARQKKRAQMAKDKTSRVTQAMGTLALGGGRGRTITSSLMGPGGTERTGRPSRQVGSSASHDTEYIEQLDIVNNHSMVRWWW